MNHLQKFATPDRNIFSTSSNHYKHLLTPQSLEIITLHELSLRKNIFPKSQMKNKC